MSGSANITQLLISYAETVVEDVVNVTGRAFGGVQGAIEQDAIAFLNATNAIKDDIENITQTAYNEVKDKIQAILNNTLTADIINEVQRAFNNTQDILEKEIAAISNATLSLKAQVENITETAFADIRKAVENNTIVEDLGGRDEIVNVTETVLDWFNATLESKITELENEFQVDHYAFPTLDVDFNMPLLPSLPAVSLEFQLDGVELYMALDVVLTEGATYTLPLYTSETPLGVNLGQYGTAGVVVSIDLILDIPTQIDISSGFHLKLDDGVAFNIEMFAQNVSSVTL